jgi:hypothetical protein
MQGDEVRDCYLIAALAAIVQSDPQRIVNMIKENHDGTYTVTLRGMGFLSAAKQTITADFPVKHHAHVAGRKALWPLIIEKAYAQQKGGLAGLESGTGRAGKAVQELTDLGRHTFNPRDKPLDYIMGQFAKAKERKWPATLTTPDTKDATLDQLETARGAPGVREIIMHHAYVVIDVDPAHNKLKLWNPWGYNHPGWVDVDRVKRVFTGAAIND